MRGIAPEEFARIIADLSPALVLYARSLCDEPEDMVQEALLKLFQQHPPPENTRAWLYRCVRNLALNNRRARARRKHHQSTLGEQKSAWFVPSSEIELDQQAAANSLEKLPHDLREIICARLWGELTYAEIAELTGLSIPTVFRRYEEGLQQLRTLLGAPWPEKTPKILRSNFRQS